MPYQLNEREALNAAMGQGIGVVVITDTTLVEESFCAIQILADATFDTLTESNKSGGLMTGYVISAPAVLYGQFTAVKLTSGKVRCYKV